MEKIFHLLSDPNISYPLSQILTQMVGFLLFFLVLKKFGWKPILKMIDERKSKIENEFKRLESIESNIEKLQIEYEQKLAHIEAEAKDKMVKAIHDGKMIAEEIVEKAHQESKDIIDRGLQNIQIEYMKTQKLIKDDIIRMILTTVEKVIDQKLDEKTHRNLISQFVDKMDDESRKE